MFSWRRTFTATAPEGAISGTGVNVPFVCKTLITLEFSVEISPDIDSDTQNLNEAVAGCGG